jgi:hypothetical protein
MLGGRTPAAQPVGLPAVDLGIGGLVQAVDKGVAKGTNEANAIMDVENEAKKKASLLLGNLTPQEKLVLQILLQKEKVYAEQMVAETGLEAVSEIPGVGPVIGETIAAVGLQVKAVADTKKKYDDDLGKLQQAQDKLQQAQAIARDPTAAVTKQASAVGQAAINQANSAAQAAANQANSAAQAAANQANSAIQAAADQASSTAQAAADQASSAAQAATSQASALGRTHSGGSRSRLPRWKRLENAHRRLLARIASPT